MEKVNLFWAIIWLIVTILSVAGIFGSKVCMIIAAVLAAGMTTMFVADYIKERRLK